MADVPHQPVVRRVEHVMQGDRQLDHAKSGPEVAAGAGDRFDQVLAQLVGDRGQLVVGHLAQVGRHVDMRQIRETRRLVHLRIVGRAPERGKGSAVKAHAHGVRDFALSKRTGV